MKTYIQLKMSEEKSFGFSSYEKPKAVKPKAEEPKVKAEEPKVEKPKAEAPKEEKKAPAKKVANKKAEPLAGLTGIARIRAKRAQRGA